MKPEETPNPAPKRKQESLTAKLVSEDARWFVFWTPRVVTVLFAIFLSIFALEVLGEGLPRAQIVGRVLIRLIPTFATFIALIIAWRWEWLGAILFSVASVVYAVWSYAYASLALYLAISFVMMVVGILFMASWETRAQPIKG